MLFRIPNKKSREWTGIYSGNYKGIINRTFNIDLDNDPGTVRLSKSLSKISDTVTDTNMLNLAVIDAFLVTDADCQASRWWALSRNGRLCKTDTTNPLDLTSAIWAEDAISQTPTDARDMTIHEHDSRDTGGSQTGRDRLFVTRDTDVAVLNDTGDGTWNNGWWVSTKGQTALQSGVPHPIEYFPYQRTTLIGDGNFIHTIDKLKVATSQRLVLPPHLEIWSIFPTPSRAWILCKGKNGKNGAIVEWDGFSQTYNYIHDAKTVSALAGVDYNGVPIVINDRGMILEYNGVGFQRMVRYGEEICLPIYQEAENLLGFPSISSGTRPISSRGMTVSDDGLIYINVLQPIAASYKHLGGIWCLDPRTGALYSKYSISLGGTTDYGHQISNTGAGAIKAVDKISVLQALNSRLLVGGQIDADYGSDKRHAIWALHDAYSSTARRGFFLTQHIPSDEIQELWDALWLEISKFSSSNDKIIVKARGVNPLADVNNRPIEKQITWTSTTTFTVTLASGDNPLALGDEIETLSGKNAGYLAHITVISGAHATLQTITIDETVTTGSGVALARFDRWKKLAVIDDTSKYVVPVKIGITSSFIQLKVELRGPAGDFGIKSISGSTDKQTKGKL